MKLNSRTLKTMSQPHSAQLGNIEINSQERIYIKNTEKALLNILEDYNEEKSKFAEIQNALLNILDDYSLEKIDMKNSQIAVLNILDDYSVEKANLENTQRAVLNILDDYSKEKLNLENTQRAVLNILDDYSKEKTNLENTQRAVLNILDDYSKEKLTLENTQRAVLNILDDYSKEKTNLENTQRAVLNILDDYSKEKLNLENTQRAVLNILDDYTIEKEKIEIINKELNILNNELEQFFYVSSHHLQEPLRMVISYLQLIEKKYKDKLDQDANDFINYAVEGGRRMKSLILGLLDYSQLRTIKSFEVIHLNELLTIVLDKFKAQITASNATIKIEELPDILGDRLLISQLFDNLISNALKFKGERNPEIIISGGKVNNFYQFSVKDNGIGIQKEYAKKLFTIFQRLHTNIKYEGTGIGLAMCKKIVEKHGGKIWFESEFGKGSTFYFTIKEKSEIEQTR